MQKQKFNPNEPYSVSLHFGPHIVHGQAEESAFGKIMQTMLLREITKKSEESFAALARTPAGVQHTFEEVEHGVSSILSSVQRWHEMLQKYESEQEFEPCSVPDWMRPGLRNQGMSDDQIDKIIIIGVEPAIPGLPDVQPSLDVVPGIVLRTVTI